MDRNINQLLPFNDCVKQLVSGVRMLESFSSCSSMTKMPVLSFHLEIYHYVKQDPSFECCITPCALCPRKRIESGISKVEFPCKNIP